MITLALLIRLAIAEVSPSSQEAVEVLNGAVREYQLNNTTEAMQQFLSISEDEKFPIAVRIEALIYIAEIELFESNRDGAIRFLSQVLELDAQHKIDRFRHQPEICILFDEVKQDAKTRLNNKPKTEQLASNTRSIRLESITPFGIYHLRNGHLMRGIAFSSIQGPSAAASIGLFGG